MKKKQWSMILVISCLLLMPVYADGKGSETKSALRIPLQVKETAGIEVKEHPITAVVPLPFGKYYDTTKFRLVDSSEHTTSAQFEVLNRWWCRDNSIRHLQVNFQPTVGAFTKKGTGISTYYLKDDGFGNNFETALKVNEAADIITVITGPVKFTVNKKRFNILDEVWLDQNHDHIFQASEKIISSNRQNGGVFLGRLPGDVQLDSSRTDVTFEIEESGPMRAVIRAEALTKYYNTEKHTHGFAIRIYAYADKPFIKIDYQLQNSAKNKVFAWPLYFEEMNLDFRLNLKDDSRVRFGLGNGSVYERTRGDGLYIAQKFHDAFEIREKQTENVITSGKVPEGFIDVSDSQRGVAAMIRNFWQTWPNGIGIDAQNKLSLQLFPWWSSQWRQKTGTPYFTSTGLYWLNDMQHVYKETLLFFHGPEVSNEELISLAKTFQYHPVATLPVSWYKETQVTLDMGGLIPLDKKLTKKGRHKKAAKKDQRLPVYSERAFNGKSAKHYNFGWNQFLIGIGRKWAPGQAGGWPSSVSNFIATENPADYYHAEQSAMGELNVRPHWMAGYIFDKDWKFLQLTENPFMGLSWRKIKGGKFKRHFDAPFLKGTHIDARPRDDEHAWFYHMEEAYYFTANPWIKDWYKFVAEFRKTRLNHLDPYTDNTTRATAHSLAHALQAYRVTGDTKIIELFRNYMNKWLRTDQDPYNGGRISQRRMKTPWAGFLSRAIISFMEEVKGKDSQAHAEAFNFLSGLMEWNYHFSNFSWRMNASKGETGKSCAWAQHFADPQAWYFLHTGKQKYLDHLNQYIDKGINGGEKAHRRVKKWNGEFQGRYVQFVRENQKPDLTPPKAILDLKAVIKGPDIVLTWTAPEEAARYHIVWSDKPISEETIIDKRLTNWWAAKPVGTDLVPIPGSKQSITIRPSKIKPFYAAIFSFDGNDNMSPMSDVAMAFQVQGDLSYPPNIPPLASDGSLTTATGTPFSGTLSAIDPDKDVLTYMIVSNGSLGTVTFTDATAGTYTYTPNANAAGTDMFTFKVSDGNADSNIATVTVKIIPKKRFEGDLIFEIGEVSLDNKWQRVSFIKAFKDPVVVAKPVSYNGKQPCVARIRNVEARGFEIRLQEWEYLDGKHASETMNYLAVERGSYMLSNEICIKAGRFNTNKTGNFKRIVFDQSFQVPPVVIASVSSFKGRQAVTGRLQNIGPTGFEFMMQEQENDAQEHNSETISYIAWEPSAGTLGDLTFEVHLVDDGVDSRWKPIVFQGTFTKPPLFFADLQTTEGIETATLRYQNKNAKKVQVKVEEEQSKDSETDHSTEAVGYVVFAFEDRSEKRE